MSITLSDIAKLILCVVICQLAGAIGSIPNVSSIPTWYATLNKPSFNPPNWIFAPVWITLYFLMGIAAFLVWNKGLATPGVTIALFMFAIQLILNALWTWIFFGWKQPFPAFIEIAILWIMILATMIQFFKISTPAGILLIPYILWVSFASVLNFSLWRLNRF